MATGVIANPNEAKSMILSDTLHDTKTSITSNPSSIDAIKSYDIGIYRVAVPDTTIFPFRYGILEILKGHGYSTARFSTINTASPRTWRVEWYTGGDWYNSTWRDEQKIVKDELNVLNPKKGTLPTGTDLNDVKTVGVYWLGGSYTYSNVPDSRPYGMLEVMMTSDSSAVTQIFHYSDSGNLRSYSVYYRLSSGTSWFPWFRMSGNGSMIASSAIAIPAAGSTVQYNLEGLTSIYHLEKWNFSSSPENKPPVDLSWTTYDAGYFAITNNGGSTSETIRPLFSIAYPKSVTAHT